MKLNKVFFFLKFLIFSKKIFFKPNKKKILIYDKNGSELFFKYLNKKDCNILCTRAEELNLYIIILLIIKFKKINLLNYFDAYIKLSKPKFIFTYTDNDFKFYRLKKLNPEKIFIVIQNGYRDFFIEGYDKILKEKLYSDHYFVFSQNFSFRVKKYIKSKYHPIGSFKNNLIFKKKSKVKNKIFFISQFIKKPLNSTNNNFIGEQKLLPKLLKFCNEKKIDLTILGRNLFKHKNEEFKFYKNLLRDRKFNIKFRKSPNDNYRLFNKKNYFIFIRSTFGFEAWSRGERAISFAVKKIEGIKSFSIDSLGHYKKKGYLWTNRINNNEFNRLIKNLFSNNNKKLTNELRNLNNYFLKLDKGNKSFIKLLKNYKIYQK